MTASDVPRTVGEAEARLKAMIEDSDTISMTLESTLAEVKALSIATAKLKEEVARHD